MAMAKSADCWLALDEISKLVGHLKGTAYNCDRWDVPNFNLLLDKLNAFFDEHPCPRAMIDATWKEKGASPGPIYDMSEVIATMLVSKGEVAMGLEVVNKIEADAVIGELEGYWNQALVEFADAIEKGVSNARK